MRVALHSLALGLRFVRNALRCGEDSRNLAEFLDSLLRQQEQGSRLSSLRKQIESNSRPRLALHDLFAAFSGFADDLHRVKPTSRTSA